MNKNIHNLSRAIIINNNHLLVCYNPNIKFDYYYLPGGHIEHNESAQTSLIRELQEETGNFEYTVERFLGCIECSFKPHNDAKCHSHEFSFYFLISCNNLTFNIIPEIIESHVHFKWVSLDKLNEINLLPETLKLLIPEWLKLNLSQAFQSQMGSNKL